MRHFRGIKIYSDPPTYFKEVKTYATDHVREKFVCFIHLHNVVCTVRRLSEQLRHCCFYAETQCVKHRRRRSFLSQLEPRRRRRRRVAGQVSDWRGIARRRRRGDAGRTVELCECCGSRHLRMRVWSLRTEVWGCAGNAESQHEWGDVMAL